MSMERGLLGGEGERWRAEQRTMFADLENEGAPWSARCYYETVCSPESYITQAEFIVREYMVQSWVWTWVKFSGRQDLAVRMVRESNARMRKEGSRHGMPVPLWLIQAFKPRRDLPEVVGAPAATGVSQGTTQLEPF
jgi:hypothetical protein